MDTLFMLPIGDWSGDGHGKKDSFFIVSNKTLDEVREAYFKARESLPRELWPESFMSEHEDFSLPRETYDAMKARGFNPWPDMDEAEVQERFEEMLQYPQWTTSDMRDYTLWFIKKGDTSIELSPIDMPMFPFYGADEKGRHIDFIGYGLMGH